MTTDVRDSISASVSSQWVGSTLIIRFDDGKANVLSTSTIEQLNQELDKANEAKAICILGRQGFFCAGYDLDELASGIDQSRELGKAGRIFLRRLIATDLPVVVGVSGHALAAGAALTLACDFRIGSRGPFRIGFNELANGLPLSELTIELAARRLASGALEKQSSARNCPIRKGPYIWVSWTPSLNHRNSRQLQLRRLNVSHESTRR